MVQIGKISVNIEHYLKTLYKKHGAIRNSLALKSIPKLKKIYEEIFKDTMLTGAIVDRLAHKAHILDISRDTSHRFDETIAWLKSGE